MESASLNSTPVGLFTVDNQGRYVFRPNKGPQEDFFSLPDDIFEAFYGGAVGGGKTISLLMLPISRGFHENPRFRGMLFRRHFPEFEDWIIPATKEAFPKLGAKYNETKHMWTFPCGSTYKFGYLDSDSDAREHDGAQWNYLAFDELTHFTYFMYTYLIARVRSSTPELPAIVRSASNPGNIGHTWVRDRFIDPWRQGFRRIYDKDSNTFRIFIPSKIKDNPALLASNPNYINQLMLLPEAERKPKMEGDWWAFSGQVFSEFRGEKVETEPENALHVIEPFDIPKFWPKILAIDWGYTHKTAAYWSAIAPDGRVYTYREYIAQKKSIQEWGADVGRLCKLDENLVLAVMDPSGWKTESHGKTIAEQFEEASDVRLEKAINDRIAGKLFMHDMLRWKNRPAKYIPSEGFSLEQEQRIYRMYGADAAREYRELFTPEPPETNLPRWQIFKNCHELAKCLPVLVYDENRTEDVAKFDGDDPYDAARYNLMAVNLYLRECQQEHEKYQKIANCYTKLEQTGDQTSFYRNISQLDRKVVRFNRFRRTNTIHRAS